jgi:hypothetical protein
MAKKMSASAIDAIAACLASLEIRDERSVSQIRACVRRISETKANDSSIARDIRQFKRAGYLESISHGKYRLIKREAVEQMAKVASLVKDKKSSFEGKDEVEKLILERDRRCIFCNGIKELIHHVHADSVEVISVENIEWGVACCGSCNNRIGDLTPQQYFEKILNERMASFTKTKNPMLLKLVRKFEKMLQILSEEEE